ncbi:BET4 [Malassezia furfur]|nr:BET4 [Malassezia furfur]
MHNVRRTAREVLSDEAVAARRAQEQESLQAYKEREDAYLEHYYSVWNYRREILLRRFAEAGADGAAVRMQLLAEDLMLTQESMRTHPKVYWLWNHRRWCLEMLPPADEAHGGAAAKWRKELALVDVMLGMDPRNFMGWNYRRYVVSELASALVGGGAPAFPASLSSDALSADARAAQLALAHEELQYTLRKIESNFSNFSAWHYRSKLLPRVWDAQGLDDAARAAAREEVCAAAAGDVHRPERPKCLAVP